jgi:hypothetical protein
MADGFVQVAVDGSGKSIDQSAITVPAGTVVVGSDGTKTTLAADAIYYRQRVVIGDPLSASGGAGVRGEVDRGVLMVDGSSLSILESIDQSLQEIKMLLTALAEN